MIEALNAIFVGLIWLVVVGYLVYLGVRFGPRAK